MKAPEAHREIALGDARARIDPRGAGLATLEVGDLELIVGYDEHQPRPLYRGALLAPWPNRIADGQYSFDGRLFTVPLNEAGRHNALHGLVDELVFDVLEHRRSRIRLAGRLEASPSYPSALEIVVDYVLDRRGLTTRVSTLNAGSRRAPYGVAPHPYLRAGKGIVDDWIVRVPAARVLNVDDARLLPTDLVELHRDDPRWLATPTLLANRRIDHAYTGLPRRAAVTVVTAQGSGVYMAWNAAVLPWVQIHTADRPEPANNRVGLAVEPMTCPPNAFRSHTDLVVLRPNDRHRASWRIGAIRP